MPLTVPAIDTRTYQELLDEALARIPIHNPEWTNFNKSDPGVTLLEVFAFLTENLLYRSNQIPERNRRKFLQLLQIRLQPASPARGIVTLNNERGDLHTITLNTELEVRAGEIPFRTEQGLDVLPIEARCYFKRTLARPSPELIAYYSRLYQSTVGQLPARTPALYETVPFPLPALREVDLGKEAVDSSLWIALLVRAHDRPAENTVEARQALRELARSTIAGKTISLGIIPAITPAERRLAPGGQAEIGSDLHLKFQVPKVPAEGLPTDGDKRSPEYQTLPAAASANVFVEPGVVQITLPASGPQIWDNLEPLEAGVGDFPPALEDTTLEDRLISWLRVRPGGDALGPQSTQIPFKLAWAGINATFVRQREHVGDELLPSGTGEPDQTIVLSKAPVLPGTVRLTVTVNGQSEQWIEIEDLMSAGPEVPVPDPRQPPGVYSAVSNKVKVFAVNAEAGEIRFGDGTRGARPPLGAVLRASYDFSLGREGNVGPDSINTGPALPSEIKVANPVRTWGGAESETVAEGEKHVPRYLQHRDRLVTTEDFRTIAMRTPGVDIGRVEAIPTFNPELGSNLPGDAAGAVTLLVVPARDPLNPDAPIPDRLFLDAICKYLDERRLVTTEVFLRGPIYIPIWVSIGITVVPGTSIADVRESVRRRAMGFLSPLPESGTTSLADDRIAGCGSFPHRLTGWPLGKAIVDLELATEVGRVPGMQSITGVQIARDGSDASSQISMRGLELPKLVGISVVSGTPVNVRELQGQKSAEPDQPLVPVPVIPEEC